MARRCRSSCAGEALPALWSCGRGWRLLRWRAASWSAAWLRLVALLGCVFCRCWPNGKQLPPQMSRWCACLQPGRLMLPDCRCLASGAAGAGLTTAAARRVSDPATHPLLPLPPRLGACRHLPFTLLLHLPTSHRSGPELGTETVLRLVDTEQEFVFEGVEARPVPSLLRGFSGEKRANLFFSNLSFSCCSELGVQLPKGLPKWSISSALAECTSATPSIICCSPRAPDGISRPC